MGRRERKNKCSLPPFPFPSYLYLLDQLGNSLSLSPLHLSFTTHNQEKADPRWCWWLSCQSINQSINPADQSSINFFFKRKGNQKCPPLLPCLWTTFLPPSSSVMSIATFATLFSRYFTVVLSQYCLHTQIPKIISRVSFF